LATAGDLREGHADDVSPLREGRQGEGLPGRRQGGDVDGDRPALGDVEMVLLPGAPIIDLELVSDRVVAGEWWRRVDAYRNRIIADVAVLERPDVDIVSAGGRGGERNLRIADDARIDIVILIQDGTGGIADVDVGIFERGAVDEDG